MPIPLVLSGCGVQGPCLTETDGSGGAWAVLGLPLRVEHTTMVDMKFLDMVAESPSISHERFCCPAPCLPAGGCPRVPPVLELTDSV